MRQVHVKWAPVIILGMCADSPSAAPATLSDLPASSPSPSSQTLSSWPTQFLHTIDESQQGREWPCFTSTLAGLDHVHMRHVNITNALHPHAGEGVAPAHLTPRVRTLSCEHGKQGSTTSH